MTPRSGGYTGPGFRATRSSGLQRASRALCDGSSPAEALVKGIAAAATVRIGSEARPPPRRVECSSHARKACTISGRHARFVAHTWQHFVCAQVLWSMPRQARSSSTTWSINLDGKGNAMAVEDDPAWKEWSVAFDNLGEANERLAELRHLPETDDTRRQAWVAVKAACVTLDAAASKIEPQVGAIARKTKPPRSPQFRLTYTLAGIKTVRDFDKLDDARTAACQIIKDHGFLPLHIETSVGSESWHEIDE